MKHPITLDLTDGTPTLRRVLRVEVREPLDLLREELHAHLGAAGARVVDADDPTRSDVVVWAIDPGDGPAALRDHRGPPVVALVESPSRPTVQALFEAGAAAVVQRGDAEPIVAASIAVANGYLVAPAAHIPLFHPPRDLPALDVHEKRWLRALANRVRIIDLAAREGCSDREMHRRLSRLYRKLGVSDRVEALMAISRTELLRPD